MSRLLKCPICGSRMYGNVNRKQKKDGTLYKDYYYYACKHRLEVDGHHCDYKKQWGQDRINDAVEEVILRLAQTPSFEEAIRQKIGVKINTVEMDAELTALQKKLRQFSGAKNKLGQKMDKLDISDRHYDRKYQNMETRMYALYDEIDAVEQSISEIETGILDARQQKISGDNVYQFLLYYHKLYDKFSDAEKKEFMNSFIEKVGIFPQEQSDGRFLRSISFQFPVFFDGKEVQKLSWDSESTVECVVRLSRKTPDDVIHVDLDLTDLPLTKAEAAATYTQIKEYVLEQTGLKVSSLYVSQVKRKCGLEVGDSYNKPKSDDKKQPQCPPEKESAIMKALEHFKMI